jgi:hypothetical protein
MKQLYQCENCGQTFTERKECYKHEQKCCDVSTRIIKMFEYVLRELKNQYNLTIHSTYFNNLDTNDYKIEIWMELDNGKMFAVTQNDFKDYNKLTDQYYIECVIDDEILKNLDTIYEGYIIRNPDEGEYLTPYLLCNDSTSLDFQEIARRLTNKKVKIEVIDFTTSIQQQFQYTENNDILCDLELD